MDKDALKRIVFIPTKEYSHLPEDFLAHMERLNIQFNVSSVEEFIQWINDKNTLCITANASLARELSDVNFPVLGYLTQQNKNESFGKTSYLVTSIEEIEPDYLVRVYNRCVGLPWDILQTERCLIREITEDDLDAFYAIYQDEDIYRYTENLFEDREQELQYITDYRKAIYEFYEYGVWTIQLYSTGEIIGRAGLSMREGYEEPELGFVIGKKWQRKGYAFEVCRAILKYGMEKLLFNKIIAFTEPENEASVCLLHKLGFQKQGESFISSIESKEEVKVNMYVIYKESEGGKF